jgi:hypothetical protein
LISFRRGPSTIPVAAAGVEKRLVDLAAGDPADRLPDHAADRTAQGRAERGSGDLEEKRRHQSVTSGKEKAWLRCRRHHGCERDFADLPRRHARAGCGQARSGSRNAWPADAAPAEQQDIAGNAPRAATAADGARQRRRASPRAGFRPSSANRAAGLPARGRRDRARRHEPARGSRSRRRAARPDDDRACRASAVPASTMSRARPPALIGTGSRRRARHRRA